MSLKDLGTVSDSEFNSRIEQAEAPEIKAGYNSLFWQQRLEKRRCLDYEEIRSYVMPSTFSFSATMKFITWVKYDNQVVHDLLSKGLPKAMSNASPSWGGPHTFLQELYWTLKRRQIFLQLLVEEGTKLIQPMDADFDYYENLCPNAVAAVTDLETVVTASEHLIRSLAEYDSEEPEWDKPDEKSTVSIDSVIELAIQCFLNTMNPETPIHEVVRTVKERFPAYAPDGGKYFCHGPGVIFFSRSELGLLIGGTAQGGIRGCNLNAKHIRAYLNNRRRDMLTRLDRDKVLLLESCTKQPFPPVPRMTVEALKQCWDGHRGVYAENTGMAVTMHISAGRSYFNCLGPCMKCRSTYRFIPGLPEHIDDWNLTVWFPTVSCAEDSWDVKREEAWKASVVLTETYLSQAI